LSAVFAPLAVSLLALATLFAGLWLVSLRTDDVGVVDIAWGPGFALAAWIEWLWASPGHPSATWLLFAVSLWAARLGVHLFLRHRMSEREDARYAAMRATDGPGFRWRSLGKVFLLQAVILWMLALPIHLAMLAPRVEGPGLLALIGALLFALGFALEAVADAALLRFRRDPERRGGLLTTGVFAWSRHPNYFGECLLWTGIGLLAWDASGTPLALLGPFALTALILKVSGIPLLEAHLKATRPDFAAYAARTSAFVPWPPRRG
jgi:steroid 5-alpha reductase family enzyme